MQKSSLNRFSRLHWQLVSRFSRFDNLAGNDQRFLQSFPWAITIILFLSLLVAVLLVPYIQYHFIHTGFRKQPKEEKKQRRSFLTILQSSYDKLIVKCFAHPIRTMGVGLLSIVAGVVIFYHYR